MGTQLLRMALLLVILSVAPAAAGRQPAAKHDRSNCRHANARAPSADRPSAPAVQATGGRVTTITLPDRVGGPLFNIARRSSNFDL